MPTLTLVCHGATAAVRAGTFPRDEPLDAAGLVAAEAASRFRRVDAAFTSPALRARQTAAALDLDPAEEPRLADLDCGSWAGRSFDSLAAEDPDAARAWIADPAAAPHRGETLLALLSRVSGWMAELAPHPGRVVAVTHPAVARAAVLTALDAPPAAFWRLEVPPLGRVRLRGGAGRWTLLGLR